VIDILIFIVPRAHRSRYYKKRDELESRGQFVAQGHHEGNEKRRFHGTKQKCNLGRNGCCAPCMDPNCNVCNIIRNGFERERCGINTGGYLGAPGRFGTGIYFTATSSKSNDYNSGSLKQLGRETTKSMFAAKVALGRGKKLQVDDTSLTAAPRGFDSVLGEKGVSLNYDECVVYDENQILPAYLIIYKV